MIIDGQNMVTLHVTCPHCNGFIEVCPNNLNCAIFRHGIFIDTLEQIDPHAPKDMCEYFVKYNMIYGCGKPFQIIQDTSGCIKTVVCDYI